MLEHLFGSKTRVKVLNLMMSDPEREFYVREMTRKLQERINSVRRELINLANLGILTYSSRNRKKYFKVDKDFILYNDLRNLILKARLVPREKFIKRIKKIGRVTFAILTGVFTGETNVVDVLVIGDINRVKLDLFIKSVKEEQGQDLNYTVMTTKEFKYRMDLDDRFLMNIFQRKHIVLIGDEKLLKKIKTKNKK